MLSFLIVVFSFLALFGGGIKTEMDSYLKAKLSGYQSYKYEIMNQPKGYAKIEIAEDKEMNINGSIAYVPVRLTRNNNSIINSYISVRLKLYKNVIVASRDIEPKEKLSSKYFEIKPEEISEIRGKVFTSFKRNRKIKKYILYKIRCCIN